MLREVRAYQQMWSLQGTAVPSLLGCATTHYTTTAFIAVSYSGQALSELPWSQELADAARSSLMQVHSAGVLHGNVGLHHFRAQSPGTSCAAHRF